MYHHGRALSINILLQNLDVGLELFLEGEILLLPHLPVLQELFVQIDAGAAVALAEVGCAHWD